MREEIKNLLEDGLIKETKSAWKASIQVVPRDEKLRMVMNYRKLNGITKKDVLPLLRINETLEKCGNAEYYSMVDLRKGFWQIPISEKNKEKTAFSTKYGTYEFNVMPFGLANAPATFQRIMNEILGEFIGKFAEVYVDNIIIYSKTFEKHMEHLTKILEALQEVNLKLSLKKSKFFQKEIRFLGHIVSKNGIKPDSRKIEAVWKFPVPKNFRELRRFFKLVSYYRKFIKSFSSIAKPLNILLKKNVEYSWIPKTQIAFEELKEKLISAPS